MRYFLHRNIVLPGFETVWKRRRTFQYLSELERSQWYDRDTLEKMQLAALKQLLKHAFQNSTYFRSAWQERGLRPDELESLADFRHYPLIDRSEIKAHRAHDQLDGFGEELDKAVVLVELPVSLRCKE